MRPKKSDHMINNRLQTARDHEAKKIKEADLSKRPAYHLTGALGWINDPNGFSVFNSEIHLFYQANPFSNSVGLIHWGHVKTKDFVRWERLPIALAPDKEYDRDGCFSGGACELPDGRHMLLYTGYAESPGFTNGYRQVQCAAFGDGVNYGKSSINPVIGSDMVPDGGSTSDFRDPKLTLKGDTLRALLVNRDASGSGAVLMYESHDGLKWKYRGTIMRNNSRYGSMWECPDMFPLDNQDVLIVSVQEMQKNIPGFREGFETLAIIGTYDDELVHFQERSITTLDHGPDFYAPTTVLLDDGRRIMTAWMQDWATSADKAEGLDFCGQMILPRELRVRHGRLYKTPVREIEAYRKDKIRHEILPASGKTQIPGLCGRCLDMTVRLRAAGHTGGSESRCFRVSVAENDSFRTVTTIDLVSGKIGVDLKNSGNPQSMAKDFCFLTEVRGGELSLRFLLDRYSMELFINDGEQTASFLVYTPQDACGISFEADAGICADVEVYKLDIRQ